MDDEPAPDPQPATFRPTPLILWSGAPRNPEYPTRVRVLEDNGHGLILAEDSLCVETEHIHRSPLIGQGLGPYDYPRF